MLLGEFGRPRPVPDATDTVFVAKESGSYKVKVMLSNCSSDFSQAVSVNVSIPPTATTITATGTVTGTTGTGIAVNYNNITRR